LKLKRAALVEDVDCERSRKVKPPSSEVKAAMGGVNKRQAVLEVLREA